MNKSITNSIFGFIVGDAMGVPTEFSNREKLQSNKVTSMTHAKNFNVPKGSFSDDTSMTIATMQSIIDIKGIDYNDIMNKFVSWVYDARYTPTNYVFDIGGTCLTAINRYYKDNISPLKCGLKEFESNGNGSLMRLMPIVIYCYYNKYNDKDSYKLIKDISSLTHANEISILGCYIYYLYYKYLLDGLDKNKAYIKIKEYNYNKYFDNKTIAYYNRILNSDIASYNINDIKSSGYIIDTLEAVLWCLLNHNNYKDIIIEAINLGNDTDTIGAIVGSLAGLYYNDIPQEWINDLQRKEYLEDIINRFIDIID